MMTNVDFVSAVVLRTPFTFADLLEYVIFAVAAVVGILLFKKSRHRIVKIVGRLIAIAAGGCLCWLLGWQIYIRMFLL